MKQTNIVLAAAVLALAVASAHLYAQLRAERAAAERLARPPTSDALAAEQPYVDPWAGLPGAASAAGALDDPLSQAPTATSGDSIATPRESSTGPAADFAPQARARQEATLRRLYGTVGADLGLSPEQEADLIALLLDQQREQSEQLRGLVGDRAARMQTMADLKRENDTELMTALGDKYLMFEDYQKSLGERMQIERASLQLEAAGIPLRDDQRKELWALMVEERDRIPRPLWTPGVPIREYAAQQQAWQENYDERVRDRASSVLTSDQLRQYDVYRNLQATQRRRQLETWHESTRPAPNPRRQSPGAT